MKGYQRALIKISGEAFAGEKRHGFDPDKISWIAGQLVPAYRKGHKLGVVVGGGNIIRGRDSESVGVPKLIGDHLGMISTVVNGVMLRWAIESLGIPCRTLSAFPVGNFVEEFELERCLNYLQNDYIVVFSGGTGNPCFTTDSAAALRAVQMSADIMIKATQTNGVYDKDPHRFPDAVLFKSITSQEVLEKRLGVMDAASIEILAGKKIPTIVLDLHKDGNLTSALAGEQVGTIIT
jgi:uridylate kinase